MKTEEIAHKTNLLVMHWIVSNTVWETGDDCQTGHEAVLIPVLPR
jgi:hypothetical protein